jgi:hypothetical protein
VLGAFESAYGGCPTACRVGNYWACTGNVNYPSPKVATTAFHFWLREYGGTTAVADAGVSFCSGNNPSCSPPLVTGTTDSTGEVSLPLQQGNGGIVGPQFEGVTGFVKVEAPEYMPYYAFSGFPFGSAQVFSYGEVLTQSTFQTYATGLGVTLRPDHGHVGVLVYDCLVNAAPDVQVTVSLHDSYTRSFQLGGMASDSTDAQGYLFFYNVPVGPITVTMTPKATGKPSSQVVASVVAGAITSVAAYPTPIP